MRRAARRERGPFGAARARRERPRERTLWIERTAEDNMYCLYVFMDRNLDTDATYDTPLFNIQNNNNKVTKLTIPEQVGLG